MQDLSPAPHRVPPVVLVVGASARALAQSARRAGIAVHAVDLFGDQDLVAATVSALPATVGGAAYPDGLVTAARRMPAGPWCYTGALENHPRVIDRLAQDRPLAGNPGAVVAAVRDPGRLGAAVRAAGLAWPDTHAAPAGLPTDGSLLLKPIASAGGRGIVRWRGGPAPAASGAWVWQRFVPGRSLAAAFLTGGGGARLVGVSRQLVGGAWCGATGFAYCGSIAGPPTPVSAPLLDQLDRLGALLAGALTLRGLVGVDLVVDRDHRLHVIEVNPRPTAAMELHERITGESLVRAHLEACGFGSDDLAPGRPVGFREPGPGTGASALAPSWWAKAVFFADRDFTCTPAWLSALRAVADPWSQAEGWPAVADIPQPGSRLHRGRPVVTVFAAAATAAGAWARVRCRMAVVRSLGGRAEASRQVAR